MAIYPGLVRSRNVRSTTVAQPNHVNAAGAVVKAGDITSRARTTGARSHINATDAQDAERLVKTINQMQDDQAASTQAQRSNPLATPYIKRGLSVAAGQQIVIPHTLKRNYTDYHLTNVQGGYTLDVVNDAATLAKYPLASFLVLKNTAAKGAVSFGVVVAGD